MSLFSFIRKQFIDVIQWTEESDQTLAWHFPLDDNEIQYGAALTVRESQMAVFVNEGKIADVFGPGMYTLTTQTLPVLTYLKNWDKLFESPFKSDVYFFSTRQQLDCRWGTAQPITLRDKDFGAVRVRAFGNYSFHIQDPKTFFTQVSGTRERYRLQELDGQLSGFVMQAIGTAVAGSGLPFLDLAANQSQFASAIAKALESSFAALGLAVDAVSLQSLSLPQELQKVLDQKIALGMVGNDLGKLTQYQIAQSIPQMAAQTGSAAGGIAGDAMGLGAGLAFGQMLTQNLQAGLAGAASSAAAAQAGVQAATQAVVQAPAQSAEEVLALLEKLGQLKEKGILTEDEFSTKKAELLRKLA